MDELKEIEEQLIETEFREKIQLAIRFLEILYEELEKSNLPEYVKKHFLLNYKGDNT